MAEYRGFDFSVYRDLLNDHTSPYLLYRYIDGAVRTYNSSYNSSYNIYGGGTVMTSVTISEIELKELARIIIRKLNDGNITEDDYLFIVQKLKDMRDTYRRISTSDPEQDSRNYAEILGNRTLAVLNILNERVPVTSPAAADEDPVTSPAAAASSSDGDPEDIDEDQDPRSRKTKYKINKKRKSTRKYRKKSKSRKSRKSRK
jgi:hypothetical protein